MHWSTLSEWVRARLTHSPLPLTIIVIGVLVTATIVGRVPAAIVGRVPATIVGRVPATIVGRVTGTIVGRVRGAGRVTAAIV